MQPQVGDAPLKMQRKNSLSPQSPKGMRKTSVYNDDVDREVGDDQSVGSTSNQLVLYTPDKLVHYTPDTGSTNQDAHDYVENRASSVGNSLASVPSRVMPSVGTFTVQCASCFKWRLIPKKEKYEEIRERILQEPFVCEQAREWRPDISCDDPADISQDGSRVWAIDKPNISQPPPGWERLLRFRGEGSTKFADVYYVAPSGKRLRSMVEVEKYLVEHPEKCGPGVKMSQFSFQTPRPLQENYIRKRPARVKNAQSDAALEMPAPLQPVEVNPLSWAAPTNADLQMGGPKLFDSYAKSSIECHHDVSPSPPKKKKKKSSSEQMYYSPVYDQPKETLNTLNTSTYDFCGVQPESS